MTRIFCLLTATIMAASCSSPRTTSVANQSGFDFEAHRGGRGLMPENTIPAMKHAVDLNVTTLEMDVVISKDNKVVVSHDQYFAETITTTPQGKPLSKKEADEHLLYKMNYDSIKKYDVGMKPHPGFTQQQKLRVYKPLLRDLIDSVEAYAKSKGKVMRYNIEVKSKAGFDGVRHPEPGTFSELLIAVLKEKNVLDRTVIQAFDVRPLQYIHKTYPTIALSYLVEKTTESLDNQLNKLGFTPAIYSPNSANVTSQLVTASHSKGMKVVPWTVNTLQEINDLVAMGIDGIISDYPNLFSQVQLKK